MTMPVRPALHHIADRDQPGSQRALRRRRQAVDPAPIADESYGSVLVFREPDNIQLELSCPRA